MEQLDGERQLAERMLRLHMRAADLMRRHQVQPGQVLDLPDDEGYRIAFGYRTSANEGIRQRYLEIPVTAAEYRSMDDGVQMRVLSELRRRLKALR